MGKKVLFIAPPYMDLYKDIIAEMERQGYEVDYIKEMSFQDDPDNIRGYSRFSKLLVSEKRFSKKIETIWKELLSSEKYNKVYDILFVLDGQGIRPVVFEVLKQRNPELKTVNYLFDTTKGVYRFDNYFKYFDNVYTFDIEEAKDFNLNLLPIYWVNEKVYDPEAADVFGLGAIKNDRYKLFQIIEKISISNGMSVYLKLYNFVNVKSMKMYKFRCLIYKVLGLKGIISPEAITSKYATKETLPPSRFRKMIASAKVVIDTSAPHQDGLTARFMWAIGLGKKIVTTNQNVEKYDVYDPDRVYIYKNKTDEDELVRFITNTNKENILKLNSLDNLRIDNWIKRILQ